MGFPKATTVLKMSTQKTILIILAVLQGCESAAVTRLTQDTPCFSGNTCRLKCSVVAGINDHGLYLYRDQTLVVACLQGRDSCKSSFPTFYRLTQVNYNTSYVDIVTFHPSFDIANWSCSDGPDGPQSHLQVVLNALPTGPLTWGSTCMSGRVTSPASLSCSGLSPGTPPANLTITDSSKQTAASSQTGSVTGTVTRGGQASCSVTWSAFPSFRLNVTTVQCDVQVAANVSLSVRDTTGQDKVVTCQAEGYPDTYTFQPWLQAWGGQEVRIVTGSQQGGQYNLTLTSYQDTGTYTCTVDNGVLDKKGQVIHSNGSANATVDGPPVLAFPTFPPTVIGEPGRRVHMYINMYASPDLDNHTWLFNSTDVTSLIPGATTRRTRDLMILPVHGTTVTTEGTVVSLHLTVSQQYTGVYRLQACNRISCTATTVSLATKMPANVNISVRNTTGHDKVITCQAEGYPDTYTFQPWLQAWGGQEVRRVTGSQRRGQYNLTLTSYQDTGTYTCTVDNGVRDPSGQVIQRNASVSVTVEGSPVLAFPSVPPIVTGEYGEQVLLDISLYACPDLDNHTWFFNSSDVTSLIPGATTSSSQGLVLLPVHGTTINTEGTVVSLYLNVSQQYTGVYRLQTCNRIGCLSTTVILVAENRSSTSFWKGFGTCVGVVVLVIITVGLFIYCWRRRRQNNNRCEESDPLYESSTEDGIQGHTNFSSYGSFDDGPPRPGNSRHEISNTSPSDSSATVPKHPASAQHENGEERQRLNDLMANDEISNPDAHGSGGEATPCSGSHRLEVPASTARNNSNSVPKRHAPAPQVDSINSQPGDFERDPIT